jgi:hypothetical protein
MESQLKPNLSIKYGLCLASLATVLLELMLTRIFSASAGYHFAFMIVSMTMFGMTLGALITWIKRSKEQEESQVTKVLTRNCFFFAISILFAYCAQIQVSNNMTAIGPEKWVILTFLLYSLPFYFSGRVISICLTRFQEVGKLYAFDLIGAALSCPLVALGLLYVDAPLLLESSSLIAALAMVLFSMRGKPMAEPKSLTAAAAVAAVFGVTLFFQPPIKLSNVTAPVEYVKWSPIGRVVATEVKGPPVTWSKVATLAGQKLPPIDQKGLYIDWGAMTVMTAGNAGQATFDIIAKDITGLGNYLRPQGSLFVIGVGGGRDILTGLQYKQKTIDGIEVNPAIVDMLRRKYADFTGNLAAQPGVSLINDEARNWLARSDKKYDVIQCSLVDTWAASSSGAFMLTENVLYTKEAFELYVRHLTDKGVLSILRWGDDKEPAQVSRMLKLAVAALQGIGVKDVSKHIILVAAPFSLSDHAIGAMLLSLNPFEQKDIDSILQFAKEQDYKLLLVPGGEAVEPFASILNENAISDPDLPTDDKPFFFSPTKTGQVKSSLAEPAQERGLDLLKFTLVLTTILVLLTIVIPAWVMTRRHHGTLKNTVLSAVYFSCLGIAFMLVEVGLIQRLTILLGNPTYGLSVVLFSLLLASGTGSYVVQILCDRGFKTKMLMVASLSGSAVLVIASALFCNFALPALDSTPLPMRILIAILVASLPGFFMGCAFPLGLTYFTRDNKEAGAWLWALNGATSVLGSIFAAIISITQGIKITIGAGGLMYLLALLSLL